MFVVSLYRFLPCILGDMKKPAFLQISPVLTFLLLSLYRLTAVNVIQWVL